LSPHDLALSRASLIHTRSPQEPISPQATVSSPLRADPVDQAAAFELRASRLLLGGVGIMVSHYGAGVRAHTEPVDARYALTISLTGGGHVAQAGQTAPLIPGQSAALTSPSMPVEVELRPGYRGLQVVVPAQVMENALEALTGAPRTTPLRFDTAVEIGSGPGAGIVRLLEFILAEADRDGMLQAPVVASRLADALVNALLLGVPHNHSHLLGRTPAREPEPRYIRRVEEYIAANAHRHVAVADLAAVAGVGARTLFAAFRAHRGQSPMAFLRAQRFELARLRLLSSTGTTVAEIALSCGFEHLGRFSMGYRKRFGEAPTQTLRRGRLQSV
jgi:AraC-like DNA-binding protein